MLNQNAGQSSHFDIFVRKYTLFMGEKKGQAVSADALEDDFEWDTNLLPSDAEGEEEAHEQKAEGDTSAVKAGEKRPATKTQKNKNKKRKKVSATLQVLFLSCALVSRHDVLCFALLYFAMIGHSRGPVQPRECYL